MRYLLLTGKVALVLFWLALLVVWNTPLAKPFASLLGLVVLLILLVNLLSLALFGSRPRRGHNLWSERLQLLLFGAFHWTAPAQQSDIAGQGVPVESSEGEARGGQTEQQHAD